MGVVSAPAAAILQSQSYFHTNISTCFVKQLRGAESPVRRAESRTDTARHQAGRERRYIGFSVQQPDLLGRAIDHLTAPSTFWPSMPT